MNTSETALQQKHTRQVRALYMAFELGEKNWKLALGDGARSPSRHTVAAGVGRCVPLGHRPAVQHTADGIWGPSSADRYARDGKVLQRHATERRPITWVYSILRQATRRLSYRTIAHRVRLNASTVAKRETQLGGFAHCHAVFALLFRSV
jgi:hypothetical protein